jgi:hypothetical protein
MHFGLVSVSQARSTDPVALLSTIRRCQGQLAVLASGEAGTGEPSTRSERDLAAENRSLDVFLGGPYFVPFAYWPQLLISNEPVLSPRISLE